MHTHTHTLLKKNDFSTELNGAEHMEGLNVNKMASSASAGSIFEESTLGVFVTHTRQRRQVTLHKRTLHFQLSQNTEPNRKQITT